MDISDQLITASQKLAKEVNALSFSSPVTHVYNPLDYARESHELYLKKHGATEKKILFLGMNPGPFGMAQTGVPFGEIPAVRDWIGVEAPVGKPKIEHPKRPIDGFACKRSEVSGRRLWGLFSECFPNAEDFFSQHFVVNYCPLLFMEETGRNRTPDKLPAEEAHPLNEACDRHLATVIKVLNPEWVVGVGGFGEQCLLRVTSQMEDWQGKVGRVLHPSPASPAANRDWAGTATKQLREQKIWN